jgi:glycosyltransferase involved in cell wall biosynthesis
VTHAFIVSEVRSLRASGVRVATASIRAVGEDEVLAPVDREEHDGTHALLPTSARVVLRAHGRALRSGPRAYAATLARALREAPAGGRDRLWQAFYFAEAMLLWAWLRDEGLEHVHVHHANVAADVAMYACLFANAADQHGPRSTWSLTIHGPTELLDVAAHNLPLKVARAAAVVCTSDFARGQVRAFADPGDLAKITTVRFRHRRGDVRAPQSRSRADEPEILCVAALSRRKGHIVLLEALAELHGGGWRPGSRSPATARSASTSNERPAASGSPAPCGSRARWATTAFLRCTPRRTCSACRVRRGGPHRPHGGDGLGVPVVATNVMGTAELVEHERSGLVVPPARADLLADALERLLIDAELRERIGAAGAGASSRSST